MGGLLSKNENEGNDHHGRRSLAEQPQPQRPALPSQKSPNFSPPSNYPRSKHANHSAQDPRDRMPRSAVPRPSPSTESSLNRETKTPYRRLMKFKGFFGLHSNHSGSTADVHSLAEETSLSPPGRQPPAPTAKDPPTVTSYATSNVKDVHQSKPASIRATEANVNSPPKNSVEVGPSKAVKPRGNPPQDVGVPPTQVSLIGNTSHDQYSNERKDVATGTSVDEADRTETHCMSVHRSRNIPLRSLLVNVKAPITPLVPASSPSPVPNKALDGTRCVSSIATTVT